MSDGQAAGGEAGTGQQQQNGQQQQQQAPWYSTVNDPEFVGTLQTRGLDKKDAVQSAHELYKAHREATQMISRLTGTPDKDRIIITPKPDAPQSEKDAFYQRLGRPAKSEEYDFKEIKFPDGSELDDGFVSMLRGAAFKANASKEQATAIARDLVQFLAKADEMDAAEQATKYNTEKMELERNWGANKEANLFIARQGAAKLGITPEAVAAMEKAAGYKAVMEGFLKAGLAFGEDRYIAGRVGNQQGVMTAEQARARLTELRQDREWGAKLMKGDRATTEEFNALTAMMVGQAA